MNFGMTTRTPIAAPLMLALALSGCASTLSGAGGPDAYACKAPEGAMCTSVSGVYANTRQAPPKPAKPDDKSPPPTTYGATSIAPSAPSNFTTSAIRSNPRVLRLWIAPWEDADGDLHEESLVHMVVDTGRWLIEHVRPAPRSRLDGVAPPVAPAPEPPSAKTPGDAPQAPTRFPVSPGSLAPNADTMTPER